MAKLLAGAPAAAALAERVRGDTALLRARGIVPCFAVLRVGEDAAALAYERGAAKRCEALGICVRRVTLPHDAPQEALLAAVNALNADPAVHGILPLLPLPAGLDGRALCRALAPEKDVDGLSDASRAAVYGGDESAAPCTAAACMQLLRHYGIDPAGRRAVVVGRSAVVGRPLAMLLLAADSTVTVCHSRTQNLAALCREADILVAAAGCRGLIGAEALRPGQVVLDVGVNTDPGGALCGDVDFAAAEAVVSAVTPVPGGVGAVTNTVLAAHVVTAAKNCENRKKGA